MERRSRRRWSRFSARLEIAVSAAAAVSGSRITYLGLENIPERGGAVVAINHTSYIDWAPSALAAYKRHRRLRFMIKEEMTQVKIINFLIKHTGTIPVDRRAGAGAYAVAVERLRAGELVAVYPEATISRSFELKEFKTGAARMAHRSAGSDHSADRLGRTPAVDQGPSAQARPREDSDHRRSRRRRCTPAETVQQTDAAMRESMTTLLHDVQQSYEHPEGAYWVPRRMGGSAPTMAEAKALDEAELAERARKRAERPSDTARADRQ